MCVKNTVHKGLRKYWIFNIIITKLTWQTLNTKKLITILAWQRTTLQNQPEHSFVLSTTLWFQNVFAELSRDTISCSRSAKPDLAKTTLKCSLCTSSCTIFNLWRFEGKRVEIMGKITAMGLRSYHLASRKFHHQLIHPFLWCKPWRRLLNWLVASLRCTDSEWP